MRNALAGHTNSFHTYSREEALAGIAEAGYRSVELTAVEGWTEHVDLDADTGELRSRLAHYGLEPVVLSGHSDLTTADGLAYGIKAVQWCADYGLPVMNTAIGGHSSQDENECAFLANIEAACRRRRGGRRGRRARDPRRHHGERRQDAAAARAHRPPAGQGRVRHRQLRVLRRRQGRRRHRHDDPVHGQRASQGQARRQGRAGTSPSPVPGRSTSAASSGNSTRPGTAARSRSRSSSRASRGRRSPRSMPA